MGQGVGRAGGGAWDGAGKGTRDGTGWDGHGSQVQWVCGAGSPPGNVEYDKLYKFIINIYYK